MDAWHNFYLHTNCSNQRKFAHSKEKLLTKINFAQSKNLLKKIAHSRNLLTEFARSIEKLLTMKNLAGSDGSTRLLNVSHQADRSTAGAHPPNGLSRNGWNVLGRTFLTKSSRPVVHCTTTCILDESSSEYKIAPFFLSKRYILESKVPCTWIQWFKQIWEMRYHQVLSLILESR